jgi:hypothetical protein
MKILKTVLTVVLVGITLLACFFAATILLSYVYDTDHALLTF